jgi:transcriptional regulator with GAF, ATPase, and Fis domain
MNLKSLKNQLLLAVSVLVIGSGLLISLLVTHRYNRSLYQTMTAQAETLTHVVALESVDKILTNDLVMLQKRLSHHVHSSPAIVYLFISRDTQILAHTFDGGFPVDLLDANVPVSEKQAGFQKIVTTTGEHILDVAWPIFEKKAGVLRLGFSQKPYRRQLIRLWLQMSGLTLGILSLALCGSLLFIRRITRPVSALAGAIKKIEEGEMGVRAPVQGENEVGELAASFNDMVCRIEDYTLKLEEQTMELERAHDQTRTFCRIVQEIGSRHSLYQIGAFLIHKFQNILKCNQMVLLVFNADRDLLFVLSANGSQVVQEPEILQTAGEVLYGLKKIRFTRNAVFKPPLVPADVQAISRQAMVPLHFEDQTLGALIISCPGDCQCNVAEIDMVGLILEQTAGVIKRAILQEDEVRNLRNRIEGKAGFSGIIGKNPRMQAIYKLIGDIAPSDATVLIQGESGTGKEVVAHAIHRNSLRKDRPFVVINCSAYPGTLLESEIFGHEKGAYTGALRQKPGRFEQADGGTVFLDEIGEIPLSAQIKLLRVLQTRKFERIGGEASLNVDVRILAATNKDLVQEVQNKRFREDLFYRLNVIPVLLPPLRDRQDDIPLLALYFLRYFSGKMNKTIKEFSPEAMRLLLDCPWPGNVRELKNCIEHTIVLSKSDRIEVSDLPTGLQAAVGTHFQSGRLVHIMANYERETLQQVLEDCGWNKKLAAQRLGISRNTLYLKLKRHEITTPY